MGEIQRGLRVNKRQTLSEERELGAEEESEGMTGEKDERGVRGQEAERREMLHEGTLQARDRRGLVQSSR